MSDSDRQPTKELLRARRTIDGVDGIELLSDWEWNSQNKSWVLHCRLTISSDANAYIPKSTEWYICVDELYPLNSIEVYPSKTNSLTTTFPHQAHNNAGSEALPWRSGNPCLSTDVNALDRYGLDKEPKEVGTRLKWHLLRALYWLELALKNELLLLGDNFELPPFNLNLNLVSSVLFFEDKVTFSDWARSEAKSGLCFLKKVANKSLIIRRFYDFEKNVIITPHSTHSKKLCETDEVGLWIRLDDIPLVEAWHTPDNWGQLRSICSTNGTDIDKYLSRAVNFMRKAKGRFIITLGFPIPDKVGSLNCHYHWQPIALPAVGEQKGKDAKKYKKNFIKKYRQDILSDETEIAWCNSHNISHEQISSRGAFNSSVVNDKILLIGAGALGSMVAELLARGGFRNLVIIDNDILMPGNLVRHTLGIDDIYNSKAVSLSRRMIAISPAASIDFIDAKFPPIQTEDIDKINSCSIIIDCSASDELIQSLNKYNFNGEKLFYSISTGYKATRLFLFYSMGDKFPVPDFTEMIESYLIEENIIAEKEGFPMEGIGCWHHIFPARIDDVWMLASIAVKNLETILLQPPTGSNLIIYDQEYESGVLCGLKRVAHIKNE